VTKEQEFFSDLSTVETHIEETLSSRIPIGFPETPPSASMGHISTVDPDCKTVDKDSKKTAMRLDLACGNNKREGFVGVDISLDTQADYLCNLDEYPWRLRKVTRNEDGSVKEVEFEAGKVIEDNSVYEIHCSHFIEHVADIKAFMEEIHRILIPGGRVTFYAPYYSSIRAMQDFTHKRFISEATFLYFNKGWMDANKLHHYGVKCNFAILSTKFLFEAEWNTRADDAKEWARKHTPNSVSDIEVVLQAIKETSEKHESKDETETLGPTDIWRMGAAIIPDGIKAGDTVAPEKEQANDAH